MSDEEPAERRRERLRREAFGRPATPADEARAADALRELTDLAAGDAAERAAQDALAAAAPPPPVRRRLPRAVAVVAVSLAGAAILVGLDLFGFGRSGDPDAAPPESPSIRFQEERPIPTRSVPVTTTGSSASADTWFSAPQTQADLTGTLQTSVEGIDPASTRIVPSSAAGWRIWIAKGPHGMLCLIAKREESSSASAQCVTREDFDASGLTLGADRLTVFWDGFVVNTSNRRVEGG
jgi:hypothetical protein